MLWKGEKRSDSEGRREPVLNQSRQLLTFPPHYARAARVPR